MKNASYLCRSSASNDPRSVNYPTNYQLKQVEINTKSSHFLKSYIEEWARLWEGNDQKAKIGYFFI